MSATNQYAQFHQACLTDRALALELLAAVPTLLDVRSGLGETPLHDLAVENELDAVRFLLAQGADPDPRNKFGNSPLQECVSICRAEYDLTEVIRTLLAAGADPYHASDTDECAWHGALKSEYAALRLLFASIPAPSVPHDLCEFFERVDSDESDDEP